MSDTGFTNEGLAVRACRGHFHVTVGGCDLALPGDPYKTREAALDVALSEAVATVAALTAENERLRRALIAHRADLHNGSSRPCPTCRESAEALGITGRVPDRCALADADAAALTSSGETTDGT